MHSYFGKYRIVEKKFDRGEGLGGVGIGKNGGGEAWVKRRRREKGKQGRLGKSG